MILWRLPISRESASFFRLPPCPRRRFFGSQCDASSHPGFARSLQSIRVWDAFDYFQSQNQSCAHLAWQKELKNKPSWQPCGRAPIKIEPVSFLCFLKWFEPRIQMLLLRQNTASVHGINPHSPLLMAIETLLSQLLQEPSRIEACLCMVTSRPV